MTHYIGKQCVFTCL